MILRYILSELKMIKQYRETYLKISDGSITLDLYCLNKDLKKRKDLYQEHKTLFPNYREAIISSLDTVVSSFQKLDEKLVGLDDLKYYQLSMLYKLLNGYSGKFKISSPIEKLLGLSPDVLSDWYIKMIDKEYISLYSRLELGLPINRNELKRVKKIYSDVNDNNIKNGVNIKKLILTRG